MNERKNKKKKKRLQACPCRTKSQDNSNSVLRREEKRRKKEERSQKEAEAEQNKRNKKNCRVKGTDASINQKEPAFPLTHLQLSCALPFLLPIILIYLSDRKLIIFMILVVAIVGNTVREKGTPLRKVTDMAKLLKYKAGIKRKVAKQNKQKKHR